MTLHDCIQQFYEDFGGDQLRNVSISSIRTELLSRISKVDGKHGIDALQKNKLVRILKKATNKEQLLLQINEFFMSLEGK